MANSSISKKSILSRGVLWIALYASLVLLPLLFLIFGKTPPGTSFWWDFSIGLGFAAALLIHMMSVLTARFRLITEPFGIDVLYYFHRLMALLILCLVLAHPIILFSVEPLLIYKFEPPISFSMLTGTVAVVAVIALVSTAIARKRLYFSYDSWRRFHVLFGIVALVFAFIHMGSIHYYTGTPSQIALWSVLACIWLGFLLYVRLIKPIILLTKPYQITDVIKERSDTWSLMLSPLGHSGIQFKPGQFAWLSAGNSPFALAEHPFSFVTSAQRKDLLGFTIKELGDFSSTIKQLKSGQRVYVDGPYGAFTIDRYPAAGYVFIAGGIGIAPIMSMLRTLADRHDGHPLLLIYANSSPASTIFHEELDSLTSILDLNIVHLYTNPPLDWHGEVGLVDEPLLARHITEAHRNWHYFTCGPAPMMQLVEVSLHNIGIPYKQMHSEIFNLV